MKKLLSDIERNQPVSCDYHTGVLVGITVAIQLLKDIESNPLPNVEMSNAIKTSSPFQIAHLMHLLFEHKGLMDSNTPDIDALFNMVARVKTRSDGSVHSLTGH